MMDRELSVQEAAKAGRIIMAVGAIVLVLVAYEFVSGLSESDVRFSALLALALLGGIWTIQKGYRLAFNMARTDELMSMPMLYLMSAIMLALGTLAIVFGYWFNAFMYATIQSVMFFGLALRLILLA